MVPRDTINTVVRENSFALYRNLVSLLADSQVDACFPLGTPKRKNDQPLRDWWPIYNGWWPPLAERNGVTGRLLALK